MLHDVVIVGSSLAGLRAAEELRQRSYDGGITVIGAEAHRPYDRPPLSKRVLSGEWEPDRASLRATDQLDGLDVHWCLGVPATRLDLDRREVVLGDGTAVGFGGLVIATGARPRRLDDQDRHAHVVGLRTVDDSIRLRDRIAAGDRRIVVVGAGFIGLEVAATARGLGNEVVVVEAAGAPLMRALGAEMGAAVAAIHGDHGVEIRCGVAVDRLTDQGAVIDGRHVDADVVVVGIGVQPCTGWLAGSGLELDDGVVCGADLGAGVPGVFAAGDVARWYHPLYGEHVRIEHWTNAAEQGAVAARNLLAHAAGDETEEYGAVPFFWSEQYGRRIQFLGRSAGADEVVVIAGSVDDRRFAALFGRGGRLTGALGVDMPREVMTLRQALAEATPMADIAS